jgi:hypothetical protein
LLSNCHDWTVRALNVAGIKTPHQMWRTTADFHSLMSELNALHVVRQIIPRIPSPSSSTVIHQ